MALQVALCVRVAVPEPPVLGAGHARFACSAFRLSICIALPSGPGGCNLS